MIISFLQGRIIVNLNLSRPQRSSHASDDQAMLAIQRIAEEHHLALGICRQRDNSIADPNPLF